uniref:WW domain-containing oxidoreductase n=1 Tax=Magallana gigas TaxID=29159 RepID=K1QBR2_MAGGI
MGGSPSFPREPLSPEKVVIVTGGNTGIGYETAKWIAMMGAHVIIACRTKERALHANFEQEKQKGTSGLTSGELSVEFMELDLSSLKSTQKFIEEFKASGKPLHVLICNAGLGMHPLSELPSPLFDHSKATANHVQKWAGLPYSPGVQYGPQVDVLPSRPNPGQAAKRGQL